ncbi:aspartic protease precursor, partial [Aphelenchoides avenae]
MAFQPGATPYACLLLAVLAHADGSSHAPLQRIPTSVPLTQLQASAAAWHANVARAFNNNTAFLDMMLGILVVNVSVGTPPQNFTVGLDTGSADFWLIDSGCTSVDCMGEPGSGYAKHRFSTT